MHLHLESRHLWSICKPVPGVEVKRNMWKGDCLSGEEERRPATQISNPGAGLIAGAMWYEGEHRGLQGLEPHCNIN